MTHFIQKSKRYEDIALFSNKPSQRRSLAKICATLVIALTGLVGLQSANAVEKLSVSGSQVLVGGQAEGMAGNSFFWTNNTWGGAPFYNRDTVRWLKQDWNSRIVRAAMGVDEGNGNYLDSRTANVNRVTTLVDAAIAEDLYVIIDWHSHHAEDYRAEAIEFFEDMARQYGNTNNVIYEIYNEPLEFTDWSNTIKPYAEAVIAAIRQIDPDNLIIVGTQKWGQELEKAADDPITGYANIAYTLHFYSGTHTQYLRDEAERAMNKGIALVATEWGTTNYSGNGPIYLEETQRWVDWMKQYNITHLNWSVNDKNESASILKPGTSTTGNWSPSDLTASGTWMRNMIRDFNSGSGNTGGGGGGNTAPTVSFSSPSGNLTVDEGYSTVVVANASDSDGSISEVKLFIDGNAVRTERHVPYEWGHNGSPAPNEVNGLSVGNHTFRVEATDNDGSTSADTFTLTVRSTDTGGGNTGGGDCQSYSGNGRVELNLSSSTCVTFSGGLSGKSVQMWDSDTNSSCNFRGTVSSTDGNGSLTVNSNYKKYTNFTGTTLNFAASNGCKYIKVRRY
jgi:hypothetical protein